VLNHEPGGAHVLVEIGHRVATVGTKADGNDAARANVGPDTSQNGPFGSKADKGHHVAGQYGRLEGLAMARSTQVELCEVGY
jgi:hypothetical protein